MYAPFDRGEKEVLEFAFLSTNMGKLTETKTETVHCGQGEEKKNSLKRIPPGPAEISSKELLRHIKTEEKFPGLERKSMRSVFGS